MKKSYLFFVMYSYQTKNIYLTIKIELEEIQNTTKQNIITIINSLIKMRSDIDITKCTKNVTLVTKDLKIYNYNEYLKTFVYYDEKIKEWVISIKPEPDYSILNYIDNKYILKLFCGKEYFKILSNNNDRLDLFDKFKKIYHIDKVEANIISIDNKNDLEMIKNTLYTDDIHYYSIIIAEKSKLLEIKEIYDMFKGHQNIKFFMITNDNIFKITCSASEINFKRVNIR